MAKAKQKAKAKGGLSAKTFGGLSKKRMASKAGPGNKMIMKSGETRVAQFVADPDDEKYWKEFDQHSFQEDGTWYYVPCAGDDCVLCLDDSESRSKTSYRFICVVYNLKEKRLQVLEGPKTLSQAIFYKYQQKPDMFLKRVWDMIRFPTQPITYNIDRGDDDPVKLKDVLKGEVPDLDKYLADEMARFYDGDGAKKTGAKKSKKSALDEDSGKKSKSKKGKSKSKK